MAKIFIVDDNVDIQNILTMQSLAEGHTVIEAENGKIGIELARERGPDHLIFDVMMPEIDGLEACRLIRA